MKWHSLTLQNIFAKLDSNELSGLTEKEAKARLQKHGQNILPKGKKKTYFYFFVRQLKSPLVYILLIAAVLTTGMALFGTSEEVGISKWVDTIVILLAVLVNVAVGFFQEFRASGILKKLTKAVRATTFVLRDGGAHEIDAKGIVPGDVVYLRAGKKVPADVRIISTKHLEVDESPLTGESQPVTKNIHAVGEDTLVSDRKNMGYMGTVVVRGEGKAIVCETGGCTEFGKIAAMTQNTDDEETPLQKRVAHLGKIATIFIVIASVIIFVFGLIASRSFEQMVMTTIAIFVAAVPEGLPAALSITLAIAASKILKKRGVVKRLVSAETLGSCSVICTDKTGTLTEGVMQVEKLLVNRNEERALQNLALSNEAVIERMENGEIKVRGETTDQAKMQAFLEDGGDPDELLTRMPRLSLLPFDSGRKYLASLHKKDEDDSYVLFASGAPEAIFDLSSSFLDGGELREFTSEKRVELRKVYEDLARVGYRMIALCERTYAKRSHLEDADLEDDQTREDLLTDMAFVGLVAIRDPIREDVPNSIKKARKAGIHIVMMTGDHILTAKAIGKELGFHTTTESVMEGRELEDLTNEELGEKLKTVHIFARVNPEHKMRVISVFQEQGEVVAMTGDGVNDAPALKNADIGVAVDSGTDIAKEASDLVLLNNSFTTIVEAVKRGRVAFSNIRKVCIFLFSASFTELVLILLAVFLDLPLPLTAVMILWTNLVGDSLPNIALAFEPGEKGIMNRHPISRHEPIFDAEGKIIVASVVLVSSILLFALFLGLHRFTELPIIHIQTIIFASLGIGTFFYVYSIKSLRRPIWSYNIFSNRALLLSTVFGIIAMLLAVYVPALNFFLGTVPLTGGDWLIVIATGFVNIVVVEFVKALFFKKQSRQA